MMILYRESNHIDCQLSEMIVDASHLHAKCINLLVVYLK